MEPWQEKHIVKNLTELVKVTDFNTIVKAHLVADCILAREDVEYLDGKKRTQGKTREAYDGFNLLLTRENAYDVLIKALEDSNQSGALKILNSGRTNRQELVVQPPSLSSDPIPEAVTSPHSNSISGAGTVNSLNIATSDSNLQDAHLSTSPNYFMLTEPFNVLNFFPMSPATIEQIKHSDIGSEILGYGSGGTIVCKGTFAQRPVAVKIQSNHNNKSRLENEINNLCLCNSHENVVRYYTSEKTPNGFHISLELCEKYTLADWVENPNCFQVGIDPLDVLRQATEGVGFLHQPNINIIHRDLKPSNILFCIRGNKAIAKISDFGISQLEPGNMHYFKCILGWTAPEIFEAANLINLGRSRTRRSHIALTVPKMTKKIDIFSLGCIYYFVLTDRDLPNPEDEGLQNRRIKYDNTQFKEDYNSLRLQCNLALVESMIAKDPNIRPNIEFILAHPIFWDHNKLLGDVSNFLTKPVPSNIELCDKCAAKVGTNFVQKISNGTPYK